MNSPEATLRVLREVHTKPLQDKCASKFQDWFTYSWLFPTSKHNNLYERISVESVLLESVELNNKAT